VTASFHIIQDILSFYWTLYNVGSRHSVHK